MTRMLKSLQFFDKKRLVVLFVFIVAFVPTAIGQDNPWIFGLYTRSNHVITHNVLEYAKLLVNVPIAYATEGAATADWVPVDISYMSMKDNGESLDVKNSNPYGFTAYDLFNNIEAGLKFGWQGAESPIGAYVYGAYCLNQYKLRFLGDLNYNKHRIQSLQMGIGVRISPLRFLMDEYDWCPIFELGTTYVHNIKYKGPNGSDINQLNNGMRTSYAVGIQLAEGRQAIMVCMDMANYDLFNKDYTPDGGFWYPYANFSNNDMNFSLRWTFSLFE